MLANKIFLVTEFVLVYGGPISTIAGATIAACTVVWQVKVPTLIKKLEKCARISRDWAGRDAVCFETSKTEAILLSRNTRHYRKKTTVAIWVGDHQVRFKCETTRWFGVWIDSALHLTTHPKKGVARARTAENRL